MAVEACQERKGAKMNRISSTLDLLQSSGTEDTLLSDRIFVLAVTLLALAMAVVFVLAVMPYA
jgi:hypothetical protein